MASRLAARVSRSAAFAADAVDRHRLEQRLADGEARVERGVGVLEHHLDPPAHRQHLRLGEREQVAAVEDRFAADRAAARLVQAQQRQAEGRLAGARFADHAQGVAGAEAKGRALDRGEFLAPEHAAADPEALGQRLGFDDHRRLGILRLGRRRAGRGAAGDVVVDDAQARRAHLEGRPAGEQRPGVGVLRVGEDARHRPLLADHAVAHDHHVVGDLADHAEVVADEQHAHPVLFLEPAEQLEDLALDGHVEGGGRLVGDQELGLAGQRHRDHHPLLLAAGELVRIGGEPPLRLGHADLAEQRLGPLQGGAIAEAEVLDQRLDDLLADREHRIERAHRVLEDAGDLLAADPLQLVAAEREHVAALERDRPGTLGVVGQEVEDRHRRHALPRARLADQGDGGVLGDLEAHAADRLDAADDAFFLAEAKGDPEVADRQQRPAGRGAHSSPRSFGSRASRRASVMSEKAVTKTAMKAVAATSCHQ